MAYFYVDAATGADSLGNGGSWAAACATLIYLLDTATVNPAAGDVVYVRANASETTPDTAAAARTITSPGTVTNPLRIIGVKSGTTNTGSSVVAADLAVRGDDNPTNNPQPVIECTGSGNDITITGGSTTFSFIKINPDDRLIVATNTVAYSFYECDVSISYLDFTGSNVNKFYNCLINFETTGGGFRMQSGAPVSVFGGEVTTTTSLTTLMQSGAGPETLSITGVDFSGATITNIHPGASSNTAIEIKNSRISFTNRYNSSPTGNRCHVELIGCNNTTSKANTGSYQDYEYEDIHGVVANEPTIVRTGGADDGADGSFSHKMTPAANAVTEGSNANLASPWMSVWVAGGSAITLTVFVANDGGVDYNRDEMWCEFYTPDASDTAQHDQTFDHATDFLLDNTTAITDDAVSSWVTAANEQKFSATVTPGFEGFAYARVHVAKRQATPDNVYIDPKIEVT